MNPESPAEFPPESPEKDRPQKQASPRLILPAKILGLAATSTTNARLQLPNAANAPFDQTMERERNLIREKAQAQREVPQPLSLDPIHKKAPTTVAATSSASNLKLPAVANAGFQETMDRERKLLREKTQERKGPQRSAVFEIIRKESEDASAPGEPRSLAGGLLALALLGVLIFAGLGGYWLHRQKAHAQALAARTPVRDQKLVEAQAEAQWLKNPEFLPFATAFKEHKAAGSDVVPTFQAIAASPSTSAEFWLAAALSAEELPTSQSALRKECRDLFYARAGLCGVESAQGLFRLANFEIENNNTVQGLALLQRAYALAPSDPIIASTLIRSLQAGGESTAAQKVLTDSIARNPQEPLLLIARAELSAAAKDYARVLSDCNRALRIDPSNLAATTLKAGTLLFQLRKDRETAAFLTQQSVLLPGNRFLLELLGISLFGDKKWHAASEAFASADALTDGKRAVSAAQFHACFGFCLQSVGKSNEAFEHYKLSYELDSKMPHTVANNYAFLLATTGGDVARARELIEGALESKPDDPNYLDTYGLVLLQAKEPEQALVHLQQANTLTKNTSPILLDHLGDASLATGDRKAALLAWKYSLNLDPTNSALRSKIDQEVTTSK